MNPKTLERVLSAPRLPTLPAVAMRVIELTERRDVSFREIADTIQNDQGLAAKILRTVNSSFYGLPKKCATINQAMVALGLNAVKTLALGFSLVKVIKDGASEGFDYEDYWRRGVFTAVGARAIAKATRAADPEEVFLGGLLQDIGVIALFQALDQEYLRVLAAAKGDHRALVKTEIRMLEVQHPDIGAMLAQRWKLPESLVAQIKYHERPTAAPVQHTRLIRCVGLANIAADLLSQVRPGENLARFNTYCDQWFDFPRDSAEALLTEITEGSREVAQLLKVSIGGKPPVEEILSAASERLVSMSLEQEHQSEELARENEQLHRAAVTDSLTGAANRRRFNEAVADSFKRAAADQSLMAIAFMDVDKFKPVNDTHGHQVGDAVLVEIASRLCRHFEPRGGIVCRYGGEEFAVILDGLGRTEAGRLAEEFRALQAAEPVDVSGCAVDVQTLSVTVSIGIAAYEPQTAHAFARAEQLVQAADQAVYAAKGSGRNCVRIFNPRPLKLSA
ncbi:MAG: GGDEF domain-containing protein [Phycisphaerales bacterium]|nr:GGDEF domain-containing protein [Phycisphaerales bacterium]